MLLTRLHIMYGTMGPSRIRNVIQLKKSMCVNSTLYSAIIPYKSYTHKCLDCRNLSLYSHLNMNIPNTTRSVITRSMATIIADKTIVNLDDIPEPPEIPTPIELVDNFNHLGEPTFSSIGLGGWTPVGMVEQCMEFLHVTCDLPWWSAIALGTLVVRIVLFPLVIISQRNAAKMNNYLPEMQLLQLKMSDARQSGNALETARYSQEMVLFMKEKKLNPFKNLIVPLAQMPIFLSFFMALRSMANLPVTSMQTGGLFWFTDLTIPDPLYILPLVTSGSLYLTIAIGTDTARLNSANLGLMKYVIKAMPIIIFPFTFKFQAAILTYWASSNLVSLVQVAFLKIPVIRKYFNIDMLIEHKSDNLPMKKKKFVEGIKDSWQNMKISKELEERHRLNEIRFAKAGKGPLIKTYKYDPTREHQQVTAPTSTLRTKKTF